MRIAYLKYGDLVEPYSRYRPGDPVPDGGPDSYLHQFLERTEGHERRIFSVFDAPGSVQGPGFVGRNLPRTLFLPGSPGRALGAMAFAARALPGLLAFAPDALVVTTSNHLLSVALAVRALRGGRVVFSCHNQLWPRAGRLGRAVQRRKNRNILRADAVICHGPYLHSHLLQLGCPAQRLVEFNAGHTYLVARRGLESPVGDRSGYFLYLGRVEREKGVLDLLDAFAGLPGNAALVYAGEGGALEELARRTGGVPRVRVLGRVPYESLGGLLDRALALVVPTRDNFPEGRCKSLSEAHVLGVPVVAPDFGVFSRRVRHGVDGLLYEANSVSGLRAAMAALLDDPGLAPSLRAGALESGRSHLTPETIFGDALEWALFGSKTGRAGR